LDGYVEPLIARDRLTVPGFLRQHGYQTACIGKWHLGFTIEGADKTGKPDGAAKKGKVKSEGAPLGAVTPDGPLNLRNEKFRTDPRPISDEVVNYTTQFSRAYLRHLTVAGEILACTLCTLHNLHFYLGLTRQAREHILAGSFQEFRRRFVAGYKTRSDTP
jgi:arylsulfatase A-like enzyme